VIFLKTAMDFDSEEAPNQAIKAVREYIEEGHHWVVDIDLKKFFDRVNRDKLMTLVVRKVKDKRVLKFIRRYLESGIMLNGIKVKNEEGTPKGGTRSVRCWRILLHEYLEKRDFLSLTTRF
jgi:RNA-directed DNA polymerase